VFGCLGVLSSVVRRKQKLHVRIKEGRLTGFVTSCVRTAFQNTILKER
jgi:hypothetical protein